MHDEKNHDYSDDDIDRIHRIHEEFPFNQEMVRQNGTRNLAEIFTKIRYPKKDNVAISQALLDFFEQAGMINNVIEWLSNATMASRFTICTPSPYIFSLLFHRFESKLQIIFVNLVNTKEIFQDSHFIPSTIP